MDIHRTINPKPLWNGAQIVGLLFLILWQISADQQYFDMLRKGAKIIEDPEVSQVEIPSSYSAYKQLPKVSEILHVLPNYTVFVIEAAVNLFDEESVP